MEPLNEDNYYTKLLSLTISNALQIPFYQQRWPSNVEEKIKTVEDLQLLPTITKQELQVHTELADSFPQSGDVAIIHHTSGTTGKLFYRYRTAEEIQFLNDFFEEERKTGRGQSSPESTPPPLKPIALTEGSPHHGANLPLRREGIQIQSAPDRFGAGHTLDILKRTFNIPGYSSKINAIMGSGPFVIQAALALFQEGINPRDIGIKVIHTRGNFLTQKTKDFIEETWGAPLFDYFSLSEILASAPSCLKCKKYSFKPTIIAEFLDPISREPVQEGLAALVLTELYPYVRHHPFIRYWTDDLVWLTPGDGCCGAQTFMPKGRLKCAIKDSSTSPETILITDCEIYEAMEAIPEIVFTESADWKWIYDMYGVVLRGLPRLTLELDKKQPGPTRIMIKFQCSFSPLYYRDEAKAVEQKLKKRLMEQSQCLRKAIDSKKYKLVVEAVPRIENPMAL